MHPRSATAAPASTRSLTPGTAQDPPAHHLRANQLTVADPTAIGGVNVAVTADDGAVVYVNGNEVARQRMGDGTVDASTFASASVSTPSARADRQLVFVPADKLVAGANTLAVETHLNYRSSSSMTVDGMVQVVTKGNEPAPAPAPEPEPAPQPQPDVPLTPDPDKPLEVLDVSALNFGPFLFSGMYWNYWNSKEAPRRQVELHREPGTVEARRQPARLGRPRRRYPLRARRLRATHHDLLRP